MLGTGAGKATPEISNGALLHGHELLLKGFTVSQVVHDAPIPTEDFRTLNRCLDQAIASAVTEFACEEDLPGSGKAALVDERRTFEIRELRNQTRIAIAAFEALRDGRVGVLGNTGELLWRSLVELRNILEHPIVGDTQPTPPRASTR